MQGFPWCLDAPKTVGLANVVSKNLCKKHNSSFTDVDSAALQAFDVFRQIAHLNNIRERITLRKRSKWTIRNFRIDGPLLERWFLKTLINVTFDGSLRIGPESTSVGMPSCELVRVAFGLRSFGEWAGMYVSAHAGQQIHSRDGVRIRPAGREDYVAVARFEFRGYNFFLNLLPMQFHMDGESKLLYHCKAFRCELKEKLSHMVRFTGW